MPQEQGAEASGSRSSRAARRRMRIPAALTSPTVTTRRRQTPAAPTSPTVATRRRRTPEGAPTSPTVTTPLSLSQSGPPQPSRTSKGQKRARADGSEDQENAEHASSGDSSAVSSPIRLPCLPGVDASAGEVLQPVFKMNPRLLDAYGKLISKNHEKSDRQMKLVTLHVPATESCLVNEELIPTRESATNTMLKTAKVVMGLSSYVDGALLTQTSGFLINWDEESKTGTILTSALIICSKSPSANEWLGRGEYIPGAEVHVHLLDKDDSFVVAELLHWDKNYNLAIFKAGMTLSAEVPSFSGVKFGQEVFVLGRDKNLDLNVDHGLVPYEGPSIYERHHYMFISCEHIKSKSVIGGPVIDLNGEVMGIIIKIPRMAFIPSSIIIKFLHMWRKFDCVPRLHIGMKLSSIKLLDPIRVEKISRKCNVDSGLIVTEVSHGSMAEKLGVRVGDVIESMNGECITTTVELENLLMGICENHLEQERGIGSSVDIQVGIFHIRKGSRCRKSLRLNVSGGVEVFVQGIYCVSERDCAPRVA